MDSFPLETLLSLKNTVITATAVAAVAFFLMRYLNRGESPFGSRELERTKAQLEHEIHLIAQRLAKETEVRSQERLSISEREKESLIETLTEALKQEAAQDVLSKLEKKLQEQAEEVAALALISRQRGETIGRLREELYSLSKRGNLNLSIGIATTLAGLLLLGMFVLQEPAAPMDPAVFAMGFLPRLSLVILIEVFAYFFLRLYKTTLIEIKYFQNEVTSMEAKFLALTVATKTGDTSHLARVVDHWAQIERNFILSKDQTTLDLERSKLEVQERSDVLGKLADLLRRKEAEK